MDVRDGTIHEYKSVPDVDLPFMREMILNPTPIQRERGRVGRNDPCPCGSGKKFKKCHLVAEPR